MSYVLTHLNRYYAALESSYGSVPALSAGNAFRALNLELELIQQYLERRDKSGTRTFGGVVAGGRRRGSFRTQAYLMSGGTPGTAPNLDPLYQAACGGAPLVFGGGTAASGCTATSIAFSASHGLTAGQAVAIAGEIRFVTQVTSATAVVVNAPFSSAPQAGAAITATITYPLAASLPSLSLFDFWQPEAAQQRIACGAAANRMTVEAQGDFHTVEFQGDTQDIVDSISFTTGEGGLAQFPSEPGSREYRGEPIAGHFGQIWLGSAPSRFLTVVQARLALDNGLELRDTEIGSAIPLGISPGDRRVSFEFDLFETDEAATRDLYSAARNRTSIPAFLQLGVSPGHLFGAYLRSLAPRPPRNDARERELRWSFTGSLASGASDDELYLAFG